MLGRLKADPDRAAERFVLFAVDTLAEKSRACVATLDPDLPQLVSERLRARAVHLCRVQGAISGTLFLIALIPATSRSSGSERGS